MKEMGITRKKKKKKIRETSWNTLVARKGREESDWLELPWGEETGSKGHSFTELEVSVMWNQNKAASEVKDFL